MSDESRNDKDCVAEPRIKVTDKRMFTEEGERRETGTDPVDRPGEEAGFIHTPLEENPGVDFTTLINAMATPALIHLGEVPHPNDGKTVVNLEQARLQIDFLSLLRVKCRGNLTGAEEDLLGRVLYQLRMLFVSKSGEAEAGTPTGPSED